MLTILEASFNSIENSDKIQDLDDMTILAEINLEGNPIVNTYTFQDDILIMIPMIEVINEEIINEPGARFIREKNKILASMKKDLDFEKLKEDVELEKASEGLDVDLKQLKDDYNTAVDGAEQIDQKITQAQISCNPNIHQLMDENLLSEYALSVKDDKITQSLTSTMMHDDPLEDHKYFQLYMKSKFDGTRKQFRKIINKIRFDEYDKFQELQVKNPELVNVYEDMKEKMVDLNA